MTIAYLIVNSRSKKPIKKRVPYSPFLPVYWRKSDAVFESGQIKGTEVIRVLIEKTLLSHSLRKYKSMTKRFKKKGRQKAVTLIDTGLQFLRHEEELPDY